MNAANSYRSYYETSVTTSSPEQLVVMLYEGAIRYLKQGINDIETKDLTGKRQSIDRALAIIHHLQGTLDMERGAEIAVELDRIYTYVTSCILSGSIKLKTAPLQEAVKLLTTLLASWEEVAKQKQIKPVASRITVAASQGSAVRLQMHG